MKVYLLGVALILGINCTLSHPLFMSLGVVALSFFSASIYYWLSWAWSFNVIMLTYLGGIMILFIYVAILSMEDQPPVSLNTPLEAGALAFWAGLFIDYSLSEWGPSQSCSISNSDISALYSSLDQKLLILLMAYLLVTLFIVMKITECFKGTMIKSA